MLDPLPSKFPSSFKAAVIKQLLKKPGLEPELIRNSANILNSAYIEPSFPVKDTVKDCSKSSLSDHEQSLQTFSVHWIWVVDYILLALDTNASLRLVLPDLSTAFDTIDYMILLNRLEHYVGFGGMAFCTLDSYLTDRRQFVLRQFEFRIEALQTMPWCTTRVGPLSMAFCNLHASLCQHYPQLWN